MLSSKLTLVEPQVVFGSAAIAPAAAEGTGEVTAQVELGSIHVTGSVTDATAAQVLAVLGSITRYMAPQIISDQLVIYTPDYGPLVIDLAALEGQSTASIVAAVQHSLAISSSAESVGTLPAPSMVFSSISLTLVPVTGQGQPQVSPVMGSLSLGGYTVQSVLTTPDPIASQDSMVFQATISSTITSYGTAVGPHAVFAQIQQKPQIYIAAPTGNAPRNMMTARYDFTSKHTVRVYELTKELLSLKQRGLITINRLVDLSNSLSTAITAPDAASAPIDPISNLAQLNTDIQALAYQYNSLREDILTLRARISSIQDELSYMQSKLGLTPTTINRTRPSEKHNMSDLQLSQGAPYTVNFLTLVQGSLNFVMTPYRQNADVTFTVSSEGDRLLQLGYTQAMKVLEEQNVKH